VTVIEKCGSNRKLRVGPDEALICDHTVYLLCNAGDRQKEYQLSFPNPLSYEDGGLSWRLRYGGDETKIKHSVSAAGHIDMLAHLVSEYSMKEVTDRLHRMRRAHKAIISAKSAIAESMEQKDG